jgi:hypothetical protein
VVLAGRATGVGGPSECSGYERRVGRARAVGGRVRVGWSDRGVVRAAVDAGLRRCAGVDPVTAWPGRGHLRGWANGLRSGAVPGRGRVAVSGGGAVKAAAAKRGSGQDRRPRCPASGPVAAPGRDRGGGGPYRRDRGRPGSGAGPRGRARGSDVCAASGLEAAAAARDRLLRWQGLDRSARSVAG